MKKYTIKLTALLLCALTLISPLLASCADGKNEAETTAASNGETGETTAEETTKLYLDDMAETMDYSGQEVRFISADEQRSIDLLETDDTGEIVNEAIWRRNQLLEERLGVDIILVNKTGYGEFNATVNNSINANSDDYDVLCGHTRFNINLAVTGALKNLNNIEHLDFDKPYWSRMYIDSITYKDNLYWATGDLTLSYISYLYAMFVNSSMWNNFFPSESIYNTVKEGKWTLDKLGEYASVAYVDLNGNGSQDDDDSYGVIMQKGHVLNGMFFASGIKYTDYDADGLPYVALNNEHTVSVFEKLHTLFYATDYGRMLENAAFDTLSIDMFTTGRLMFCPGTFGLAENENIRAMDEDFYVIPLPKYDEAQESYRVNQYDGVPIYGIPVTANPDNLDGIGATLEAMCSMSSSMVVPVYYDKALKNKYSRDAETADMIDLIHSCITCDFSFAWGDTVGSVYNVFYDNIQNDSITSSMAKLEKVWKISMSRLITKLEENAVN